MTTLSIASPVTKEFFDTCPQCEGEGYRYAIYYGYWGPQGESRTHCDECDGEGRVEVACSDCDGDGTCEGDEGVIPCPTCQL